MQKSLSYLQYFSSFFKGSLNLLAQFLALVWQLQSRSSILFVYSIGQLVFEGMLVFFA